MRKCVSIVIPTLGRKSLYPLINNLQKQKFNHSYEIILIPQVTLKEDLLKAKKITINYERKNLGFSYYRNIGVKLSKGNILIFIDDDEMPINDKWLYHITKPILDKKEEVVTAGVNIPLNQGYLADSISLLGFPGGGAIGFKIMWKVDKKNYTNHLCSGNFAISKYILNKINGFDNSLKFGNEDADLAERLIKQKIKIKYEAKATVYHEPRKKIIDYIKWVMMRGKSANISKNKKQINYNNIANRLISSLKIIKKTINTKYFPMVVFLIFNQYFFNFIGYILGRIRK